MECFVLIVGPDWVFWRNMLTGLFERPITDISHGD